MQSSSEFCKVPMSKYTDIHSLKTFFNYILLNSIQSVHKLLSLLSSYERWVKFPGSTAGQSWKSLHSKRPNSFFYMGRNLATGKIRPWPGHSLRSGTSHALRGANEERQICLPDTFADHTLTLWPTSNHPSTSLSRQGQGQSYQCAHASKSSNLGYEIRHLHSSSLTCFLPSERNNGYLDFLQFARHTQFMEYYFHSR